MSFTLKVLRLYKNTNRFYLKQSDGSKQELNEITQWGRKIFVLFIEDGYVSEGAVSLKRRMEWRSGEKQNKFKWLS